MIQILKRACRGLDYRVHDLARVHREIRVLREGGNLVIYPDEGAIAIALPAIGVSKLLLRRERRRRRQVASFANRSSERLLRRLTFMMFQTGLVSRDSWIVDIGAWLGDNTIPWAKILDSGGVVAIDPSDRNIDFIGVVSQLNSIANIRPVVAVCSDAAGQPLSFTGILDHATFRSAGKDEVGMISTTIDEIVDDLGNPVIGLLHLDVEGFEYRVLNGAVRTISSSRPIILFEHHLQDADGLKVIVNWLNAKDFETRMINEVLPGCRLDCRNFLAWPREKFAEETLMAGAETITWDGVFPSTPGPALLPFDLS